MPTIAIFAQGEMGAGLSKRLVSRGARVVTVLAGRSDASRRRAFDAGMEDVAWEAISSADMFLSVLPPGEALDLAERLATEWSGAERLPLYVDCNAVSPQTVERVGAAIQRSGASFVDAGIIGGPPREGTEGPTIYASGARSADFASLRAFGLNIQTMEGQVGAASALKMSYAGITKGMTAIASAMVLGAQRAGAGEGLKRELAVSQPALSNWLSKQCLGMIPKAYRWVAEMDEIAAFQGDDQAAANIYHAIAQFYSRLAADEAGLKTETDSLRRFFADQSV